jgi:hypothetical protein
MNEDPKKRNLKKKNKTVGQKEREIIKTNGNG